MYEEEIDQENTNYELDYNDHDRVKPLKYHKMQSKSSNKDSKKVAKEAKYDDLPFINFFKNLNIKNKFNSIKESSKEHNSSFYKYLFAGITLIATIAIFSVILHPMTFIGVSSVILSALAVTAVAVVSGIAVSSLFKKDSKATTEKQGGVDKLTGYSQEQVNQMYKKLRDKFDKTTPPAKLKNKDQNDHNKDILDSHTKSSSDDLSKTRSRS